MVAMPGVNARDTAPALGAVAMTASVSYAAGRAFVFNCTASGTITVTFQDGSTFTWNCILNTVYEFNWSVISYSLANSAMGNAAVLY
jgi:hypothetical protein